jgi:non-heme chloroperoxidase
MREVKKVAGLEVIGHAAEGTTRNTPLLFVHGAFAAAWCWEEHFLPYMAQRGYASYAVSLRGHGGSDGRETLALASIDDFTTDMLLVAERMPATPVLIGHSMGAIVVQRGMARARAPAAVLMAPVPPQGLAGSALLLAARDPDLFRELNLTQHAHPRYATMEGLRRAVFSRSLPDEVVGRYFARMQPESQRAMFDLAWPQYFWVRASAAPVLILGAENDTLFPAETVAETARVHGTRAEIFPDMAHAMMLEAAWQRVADRILSWLAECRLD